MESDFSEVYSRRTRGNGYVLQQENPHREQVSAEIGNSPVLSRRLDKHMEVPFNLCHYNLNTSLPSPA